MPVNIPQESLKIIPHGCVVKLQAVYDSLKSAEKKAADLLINKPAFFAQSTISESANEADCSEATLVRLARKLGYEGYPDLKQCLKGCNVESVDSDAFNLYNNISENDNCRTIVRKVFQYSIQALEDTLNVLDMSEYGKAVEAIAHADRLVFCGVGDAANVARSGFQKFIRTGINVQSAVDPDVQLIAASHLNKGDVLIAISHSGRTKSIVELVKYTKTTGATIVCITNYPVSPLAKNSDIVLLTAAFTEHVNGEVMSKRVTELCIIESLFVNVLIVKKDKLAEGLKKSNIALEVNKL